MAGLEVKLHGDRALDRALEALRQPQLRRIQRRSLQRNARTFARTVQRRYLSGQLLGVITGELHDSIASDPSTLPERIAIGSTHPGAGALNFGWPAKNLPAHPFMEAAITRLSADAWPLEWLAIIDEEVPRA